jgi:hypothetical protein
MSQRVFHNQLEGRWGKILDAKDDAFMSPKNKTAKKLHLDQIWKVASPASKKAIWDFLDALRLIPVADTDLETMTDMTKMFPPDFMSKIQGIAMAAKVRLDEAGVKPGLDADTMAIMMDEMKKSGILPLD